MLLAKKPHPSDTVISLELGIQGDESTYTFLSNSNKMLSVIMMVPIEMVFVMKSLSFIIL